ncbi:hypothetical protein E2562_004889 [Oryza meyeriana var. granulata]|uniref:Uncharacterized protein n=1 Tax=Oryza meyeriana var. granulata TaxID=110450 RepID=A0A6G1C4C9_9ORYZ|nr:hypothetical protein E2562_004889 [Oryza meyeriana var. granulata]
MLSLWSYSQKLHNNSMDPWPRGVRLQGTPTGIEDSNANQRAKVAAGGTDFVRPHVLDTLDRKQAQTEFNDGDTEHKHTLVDLVNGENNNRSLMREMTCYGLCPKPRTTKVPWLLRTKHTVLDSIVDDAIAENDAK